MKDAFLIFLFSKHIFVAGSKPSPDAFPTLFSLAHHFSIRILEGGDYADPSFIRLAGQVLGRRIPAAFYRGFPDSVRALSPDELLYDQCAHYAVTYGCGLFDFPGRSLLEETVTRRAMAEKTDPRDFRILTEEEAEKELRRSVEAMLSSTRPPSESRYQLLRAYLDEYPPLSSPIASRDTAVRLLSDTRDLSLCRFLSLPDAVRLVREMQYRIYGSEDISKLNWRNRDRKFLTRVLDRLFQEQKGDERTVFESRRHWKGFLHHIHYRPVNDRAADLISRLRTGKNESVASAFEKRLLEKDVVGAAVLLRREKGSAALLRRLDHLLSRCRNREEVDAVLAEAETRNPVVLLQLLFHYDSVSRQTSRIFRFTRFGLLHLHAETGEEQKRRRSRIAPCLLPILESRLRGNLASLYRSSLGKLYIEPDMKKIALPLKESASMGGFGTLPSGSRLPIPEGKKIRAFVYWEKVDDIDLASVGIDGRGEQLEFSWRTMADRQSGAITYSGDQTSGYLGGSEYFDVQLDGFRKKYPAIRYLVFCANVYSDADFASCFCRAGFMMREERDSGQIFEPKTVSSAFTVNCPSTFAYLFALDLERREMVWLNIARSGSRHVAGESDFSFLLDAFHTLEVMNLYDLFSLMAAERVEDPAEAGLIVGDGDYRSLGGKAQIRSADTERIAALMNRVSPIAGKANDNC